MANLFIELYNYRPAWHALSRSEREQVRQGVLQALVTLEASGLEIFGWGENDAATDQRAPFDFFCAYRTPSKAFTRAFESAIRPSGWHDLFDQVAISGDQETPADILARNVDVATDPSDIRV